MPEYVAGKRQLSARCWDLAHALHKWRDVLDAEIGADRDQWWWKRVASMLRAGLGLVRRLKSSVGHGLSVCPCTRWILLAEGRGRLARRRSEGCFSSRCCEGEASFWFHARKRRSVGWICLPRLCMTLAVKDFDR
eukprot:6188892-Pleurochrysis_carterae.AAC.3